MSYETDVIESYAVSPSPEKSYFFTASIAIGGGIGGLVGLVIEAVKQNGDMFGDILEGALIGAGIGATLCLGTHAVIGIKKGADYVIDRCRTKN